MPFQVKILSVRDEAPGVKTFTLTKPHELKFIPGQFCMVSQEGFDGERPFTFASSPGDAYIEFTIRQMGPFTTRLFTLQRGSKIWISEPVGTALNFTKEITQDIVFLAGGTGITPFMSIMRYADIKELPNKMTLIYSNRTKKDILYESEFRHMQHTVVHTLTDEQPDKWKGELGRINAEMVLRHVKNVHDCLFYICGPPGFNNDMKGMLWNMGVGQEKWRIEPWEIAGR